MTRGRVGAGVIAGSAAGLVMSAAMMGYMRWRGESVWAEPDLIAVMWTGPEGAERKSSNQILRGY